MDGKSFCGLVKSNGNLKFEISAKEILEEIRYYGNKFWNLLTIRKYYIGIDNTQVTDSMKIHTVENKNVQLE